MYNQVLFVWIAAALLQSVELQNSHENTVNTDGYDLILSKIESRLNLASKIVETARRELRNDIRQLCRNGTCSPVSVDCNKWKRSYPDRKPVDCGDIYNDGFTTSGTYQIWPKPKPSTEPLLVYCDMEDTGGWTVIQRRGVFGNPRDYFFQDWNAYKAGFGHLLREFWIGNDNLFTLTSQRSYQLKVDLRSFEDDSIKYATYADFWVDDPLHSYTLHIGAYNGTAGDSLRTQNGKKFSTYDRDNDNNYDTNCATTFKGAWWYSPECLDSNLNGMHLNGANVAFGEGIVWQTFKGFSYSLKGSVMKIRAANVS